MTSQLPDDVITSHPDVIINSASKILVCVKPECQEEKSMKIPRAIELTEVHVKSFAHFGAVWSI